MDPQPGKRRLEQSEQSAPAVKKAHTIATPMVEGIVQEKLKKLPLGEKINCTIKTDLTDATFVIEGKVIYAGSDFISIYSPHLNSLLKENKNKIKLNNVSLMDFYTMLMYLYDHSRKIKAKDVESLLVLGDRFNIKCLMDRVENYLMEYKTAEKFKISSKLMLVERFRLARLQADCFNWIWSRKRKDIVMNSKVFNELSEVSKAAFNAWIPNDELRSHSLFNIREKSHYTALREVKIVEEPPGGFIAKGVVGVRDRDEVLERYGNQFVDIAGFSWGIDEVEYTFFGGDFSLFLIVNQNRPSNLKWTAEGFVELTMTKRSSYPIDTEENAVLVEKYAFSFSNTNQLGLLKDKTSMFLRCYIIHATVYITKITELRDDPKFDFSAPSDLSDVVLKVEGRELHVNRQYLSSVSRRFREMFHNSDEDGEKLKVVELKEVEYTDVVELLNWMYPSSWRNVTATSAFSILMAAKKLKVDIDQSLIINYIESLSPNAFYPERIIFWFHFNIDLRDELYRSDFYKSRNTNTKTEMEATYNKLNDCYLFKKMTTDKKIELYEWMFKKEYESEDSDSDY